MYLIPTMMKKKRTELGMSQRLFAEHIGVHQNTVLYYELGKAIPKEEMHPMIAKLLDMSVREVERMCENARIERIKGNKNGQDYKASTGS